MPAQPRTDRIQIRGVGPVQLGGEAVLVGPVAPPSVLFPVPVDQSPFVGSSTSTLGAERESVIVDGWVPIILDRFIGLLELVEEVAAIIAEPGTNSADLHVTTFARPLSEAVREKVYDSERAIIDAYPMKTFDFHLRESLADGGSPLLPDAPYATVLWHRGGQSDAE